jgi:hypothetical protein
LLRAGTTASETTERENLEPHAEQTINSYNRLTRASPSVKALRLVKFIA